MREQGRKRRNVILNLFFHLYNELVYSTQTTMDMSLSDLPELVMDREAWRAAIHGVTNSWT